MLVVRHAWASTNRPWRAHVAVVSETEGAAARDIAWVEEITGGKVARLERTSTGSSRATFLVDVQLPDRRTAELVLRRDTGDGPLSNTELSLARESTVYRALAGTGVLIPRLLSVLPGGEALLVERARGQENLGTASEEERTAVVESFVHALAALHNIDPATLDLPGFARPRTGPEHALLDLSLWERIFNERVRRPAPLVRFAFGWLRRHTPEKVARTVLCHGDVGPGNFLFADGEVTALLDWEFAHVGDPMDDLAWLTVRGNHLSSFGDQARNFASYAEFTGIPIDPARIRYYQAFVLLRMAVSCLVALDERSGNMDVSVHLNLLPALEKLLPELLAEMSGVSIPAVELPQPLAPVPNGEVIEFIQTSVASLSREVADASTRARLRGIGGLLAHLEAADRYGQAVEEATLAELGDILRSLPASLSEGLATLDEMVRSGRGAEEDLLAFFCRHGQRGVSLWPASARTARPILPIEVAEQDG